MRLFPSPSYFSTAAHVCAKAITHVAYQRGLPQVTWIKPESQPLFAAIAAVGANVLLNRFDSENNNGKLNGLKTFTTTLAIDAVLWGLYRGYNTYVKELPVQPWMQVALAITSTLLLMGSQLFKSAPPPKGPEAPQPAGGTQMSREEPSGQQRFEINRRTGSGSTSSADSASVATPQHPSRRSPTNNDPASLPADPMMVRESAIGAAADKILARPDLITGFASGYDQCSEGAKPDLHALIATALKKSTHLESGGCQLQQDVIKYILCLDSVDSNAAYEIPCIQSELNFYTATKFFEGTQVRLLLHVEEDDEAKRELAGFLAIEQHNKGHVRFSYVDLEELKEGQGAMMLRQAARPQPIGEATDELTDTKAETLLEMLMKDPAKLANFTTHYQLHPDERDFLKRLFERALALSPREEGKISQIQSVLIESIFGSDTNQQQLLLTCNRAEMQFYTVTNLFAGTPVQLQLEVDQHPRGSAFAINSAIPVGQFCYVPDSPLKRAIRAREERIKLKNQELQQADRATRRKKSLKLTNLPPTPAGKGASSSNEASMKGILTELSSVNIEDLDTSEGYHQVVTSLYSQINDNYNNFAKLRNFYFDSQNENSRPKVLKLLKLMVQISMDQSSGEIMPGITPFQSYLLGKLVTGQLAVGTTVHTEGPLDDDFYQALFEDSDIKVVRARKE